MAKQKPENRMISRIKPHWEAAGFYIEKTNNPYLSGPPDLYVERAVNRVGWVEAKFWSRKSIPEADESSQRYIEAMLSPHQEIWLRRAQKNGVPVAMLCGFQNPKQFFFFEPFLYKLYQPLTYEQLVVETIKWIETSDGYGTGD